MQNKAKQRLMKIIGLFYFVDKSIIWRKSGKFKIRKRENKKGDYMVKIQQNNKKKNIEKKQIK